MESSSKENNTLLTTPAESRPDLEEAAEPEAADGKRGIQWREIIRQAFDKARQTQQPRTTRRELSKDKSKSLVVLCGAAVAMLLLFLGIFSSPQKAKRTGGRAGAPDLGRRITPGQESSQSGSVTPMLNAEVSGDETVNRGDVTPEEIGRTARPGRPKAPAVQQTTPQYALNKIDFDSTPPQEPSHQRPPQPPSPDESPEAALRKPSLVFVRGAETGAAGGAPLRPAVLEQSDLATLLPPGARLVARLESAASSGLKEPVVAVIEYNFEREGEIVVPAGAKAIGQLRQADRSGNVDIRFDRLEMPDGTTQRMDGVAMDLAFRPLKGSVSGRKTGTKFLVRTFTGLGTVASYLVGNGGGSGFYGPLSESALLRERVANNVGVAGDEELNELAFNQNIVVTVPGNTRFYIVLGTGAVGRDTGSRQATTSVPVGSKAATIPSLEELRQLMQLKQELSAMYQQPSTSPTTSEAPQ
jgi:hypothetical protein